MRCLKVCGVLILISLLLAGCGSKPLARVNGEKIDKEEFYKRLEVVAGKQVLTEIINETLQLQLAAKEGVLPTDEEVEAKINDLKQLQPDLENQLKQQGLTMESFRRKVLVELAGFNIATKGASVSDKEVQDFYNANKSTQFTRPDRVRLRRIVVDNKKDADQVKEMLDKKIDFATIAQMKSIDPQTKAQGGDMGFIPKNDPRIPREILKPAFSLKEGEHTEEPILMTVTDPKTNKPKTFYSFIKVDERGKKEVLPLDKVKRSIWENLMGQKAKPQDWQKKVQEYQVAADIKVFSDRYKSLEKKPGQGSVPAAAPAQP